MRLFVQFDVEGPLERFVEEEWPLMLGRLYAQPVEAHVDDENVTVALSIAPPDEEGQVKP